ncbi:sigma-70 family RNA polymerase sigma factor [Jidongwangia harbinensis]|uniref:sigma-70 family RNA polymerase sigma factor n=1 Tax=Jidongwangia harbinensis TaxID=2878561 RepID=UPI001CDA252A|nr:sigma-70 family RNA polymerase sigma factor [Jidongwangia harbinensis]MCA2218714.1 sigma-70 family RNA polymerase sigma factor [Jidongwangia harbinensis]
MQALDRETEHLVVAAQHGDRRAAEDLVARHLPLLYNLVGRALDGHTDVDDVVQETILRAFRDLSSLRSPARFRSWLVSIAMHQISSRMRAWRLHRERTGHLGEAGDLPDPHADFAEVTILRLGLSGQRRQVAEAGRWLDPGDRELLSLWWLELAGAVNRADIAAALGISGAHTRVRIQRMHRRLDLSRYLVAALRARPRCPVLDEAARHWDGVPGPRWRKRFARHLRDCDVCGSVRTGFVPIERLLAGLALVPVPASLSVTIAGGALTAGAVAGGAASGAGTAVGVSLGGWLGSATGLKAAVAVATVATSGGWYLARPDPATPPPVAAPPAASARPAPPASPARPGTVPRRTSAPAPEPPPATPASSASPSRTGLLRLGEATLRPAGDPGRTVVPRDGELVVVSLPPGETGAATFSVLTGLADPACYSLRSGDGRYVRHSSWRLVLAVAEDAPLFRSDATFCPQRAADGAVRLRSHNYPGSYVHRRGDEMWVDRAEPTDDFTAESTFVVDPV